MPNSNPTHFVVTRPINRATQLVQLLSAISPVDDQIHISECPLIRISDHSGVIPDNLSQFDGAIFISGNAVDQSKRLLNDKQWKELLSVPLYAIGQQTANILQGDVDCLSSTSENSPLAVRYPQQMNSEGLLSMSDFSELSNKSWLIVKGVGGREKLRKGLETGGATVTELHVYQRKLPDLVAQRQIASYNQSNPVWLVTSLQALNNLWRILEHKIHSCRLIVSSDRIANEATKMGFKVVAQAKDATDKQLVESVKQFILGA